MLKFYVNSRVKSDPLIDNNFRMVQEICKRKFFVVMFFMNYFKYHLLQSGLENRKIQGFEYKLSKTQLVFQENIHF